MEPKNTKVIDKYLKEEKMSLKELIRLNNPIGASVLNLFEVAANFGKAIPTTQKVEPNVTEAKLSVRIKDKSASKISEEIIELPYGFSQIVCTGTEEEILDYFMYLAKGSNDFLNKPYMEEKDVVDFVKQNFAIFKCPPKGKCFPLNLTTEQKGRMRYFVTEFRNEYGSKIVNEARKYAQLLIHNFELFKDDKLLSLVNSMQLKKGPVEKNRIPTPRKKHPNLR